MSQPKGLGKTQKKQRGEAVLELGLCVGLEMQAIPCAGKQIYRGGQQGGAGGGGRIDCQRAFTKVPGSCTYALCGFMDAFVHPREYFQPSKLFSIF